VFGFIEGGVEVHADVEIGELGLGAFGRRGRGVVRAGGDGDFAALLEAGWLAGDHDHGEVLRADAFGAVDFGKGVGEAVGFAGAVELFDELLGEGELVRGGVDDDGVLIGYEVDLDVRREDVAEGYYDLAALGLLAGVGEVEGLDASVGHLGFHLSRLAGLLGGGFCWLGVGGLCRGGESECQGEGGEGFDELHLWSPGSGAGEFIRWVRLGVGGRRIGRRLGRRRCARRGWRR